MADASLRACDDIARERDIARCVLSTYASLHANGKPRRSQYTSLCAFVVSERANARDASRAFTRVVALGTGTKSIPFRARDSHGYAVADNHAEVIARRSLKRWMMEQWRAVAEGECAWSAFELDVESDRDRDVRCGRGNDGTTFDRECDETTNERTRTRSRGAFVRLKPGVEFHAYCSQSPCGDASVFDRPRMKGVRETEGECVDIGIGKPSTTSEGEGRARMKRAKTNGASGGGAGATGAKLVAKRGDGVDSSRDREHGVKSQKLGAARIKPGRGDASDCMSCSDKLCRWCCVGLEGALLSTMLREPIRLSSVTVAMPNIDDDERDDDGELQETLKQNVLNALKRALETRMDVPGVSASTRGMFRSPTLVVGAPSDPSLTSYDGVRNGDRVACPTTISHIHREKGFKGDGRPQTEVTLGATGYKLGSAAPKASAPPAERERTAAKIAAQISKRIAFERFIDLFAAFADRFPETARNHPMTPVVAAAANAEASYADVKRRAKMISGIDVMDDAMRAPGSPLEFWVDSARKNELYGAFVVRERSTDARSRDYQPRNGIQN